MEIDKEKLKRYAALKIDEKKIKEELSELGPDIKADIQEAGIDKVELSDFGVFSIKSVPIWKYSPAVEKLEENLERMKVSERASGEAVSEPRYDLVFKSKT